MKGYTSYGKGIKALTFESFKKAHKDIERFTYFSDLDWEKEYKEATGKEAKIKGV